MFVFIITLIIIFIFGCFLLSESFNGLFAEIVESDIQKKFSIVIAARNEVENITSLISHLTNLDYPQNNFEVILIDDSSTDDTYNLIKELTGDIPNFSLLSTKKCDSNGKRTALTLGINKAKFPYILITDADCHPEKNWLNAYSAKFSMDYDLLYGFAPFYRHKKLVNNISCFENLRSTFLAFSMTALGLPYTATARNFGFSKRVFELVGGYSNTRDTKSGDDDLLLREVVKKKLKIGVVTENNSLVYSETKNNFSEYFLQKARHTQTSFYYLIKYKLILGFWHLLNLVFMFSPFLMFINLSFGLLFPVKFICDLFVVKSSQKKIKYNFRVLEIIYLQIAYELLLIINFINARFSKIKWK